MSGTGYTCVRRIFCWLNCLLWLSGCGIFGVGLWLRFAYEGYLSLLPQYALLSAESICISVGVVTFILAFFGCCGSWFQNRCLLITYFSCVILTFEIEFFLGALAFIFREKLGHQLKWELKDGIQHHYNITVHIPNSLVTIWDKVHTEFKCCGVESAANWYQIDAWPKENWVPQSCCINPDENCGKTYSPELWYPRGCVDQVHMWFVERLHIIGIIGLLVAFIQLFGLISSMLMFCTVRHRRSTHKYKAFQPSPSIRIN